MELGRVGVWWSGTWRGADGTPGAAAAEMESLGYRALWSSGGLEPGFPDRFGRLLAGTQHVAVASGILSIWHATPAQAGAVTTITAGVAAIVTAVAARPVVVPAVTGAVATIASAAAAFGLHLTAAQIGTALPAATMILALVLRQAITPVATLNAAKKAAAAPAPH